MTVLRRSSRLVCLGITALVAAWRTSLIAATTIIAIVFEYLAARRCVWDLLVAAASLFAIAGTLFAAAGGTSVLRLFEVGMREVEDEPLSLPCPLLALRAPRDEASLIIGLGQVVQGLWHAAARFVVLAAGPLGRRLAPPGSDGTISSWWLPCACCPGSAGGSTYGRPRP